MSCKKQGEEEPEQKSEKDKRIFELIFLMDILTANEKVLLYNTTVAI